MDCDIDFDGVLSDGVVPDGVVSDGVVSDGIVSDGDVDVSDGVDVVEPVRRTSEKSELLLKGASVATSSVEEPSSFQEAINSQNKAKWEPAMESEMRSLKSRNDVWELVNNCQRIGKSWVANGCLK